LDNDSIENDVMSGKACPPSSIFYSRPIVIVNMKIFTKRALPEIIGRAVLGRDLRFSKE
jgi:hypothetical protein